VNVLDTNVLSELIRARPDGRVVGYVDKLDPDLTFTTAVTMAEIRHGVARLSAGQRRDTLSTATEMLFDEILAGRVLGFDAGCTADYAAICASGESRGRPIAGPDAMIAAICRWHHAVLITRNTRDFELTGVDVVDPWRAEG
jgi:toxin FitB